MDEGYLRAVIQRMTIAHQEVDTAAALLHNTKEHVRLVLGHVLEALAATEAGNHMSGRIEGLNEDLDSALAKLDGLADNCDQIVASIAAEIQGS